MNTRRVEKIKEREKEGTTETATSIVLCERSRENRIKKKGKQKIQDRNTKQQFIIPLFFPNIMTTLLLQCYNDWYSPWLSIGMMECFDRLQVSHQRERKNTPRVKFNFLVIYLSDENIHVLNLLRCDSGPKKYNFLMIYLSDEIIHMFNSLRSKVCLFL